MLKNIKEPFCGYDDITLIPDYSSLKGRDECDISIELFGEKYDFPLIIAPMLSITTPEMIYGCWKNKIVTTLHRYFKDAETQYNYIYLGLGEILARKEEDQFVYGLITNNCIDFPFLKNKIKKIIESIYFSVGGIKKHKEWIDYLVQEKNISKFCVDMAHGDIQECIDTCEYIKSICKESKIISGNYATYEGIKRNKFADMYRVGISCGSCCTTARNTGFGLPTYTSLLDCYNRSEKEIVIADGGIKVNGDIAKAMSAGADLVMIGYLLAGTSASSGYCVDQNFKSCHNGSENICYKNYYGMASKVAKNAIGIAGSVEGDSGFVKYTGNLQDVLDGIKENLKSSLAYCGAKNWKEFQSKVIVKRITSNGSYEGKSRLTH